VPLVAGGFCCVLHLASFCGVSAPRRLTKYILLLGQGYGNTAAYVRRNRSRCNL
jgi:hypothetical protein